MADEEIPASFGELAELIDKTVYRAWEIRAHHELLPSKGSVVHRVLTLRPDDPFTSTTIQMLCGGVIMLLAGLVTGKAGRVDFDALSTSSIVGLVYLIFAGSLLAFTAYTWLLQHAPISKVSTYAYVNPVVAIFFGWILLGEPVTLPIAIGAMVIVASVAYIVRRESTASSEPTELPAEPAPQPAAQLLTDD